MWSSILAILSHSDESYLAQNKIVCGLESMSCILNFNGRQTYFEVKLVKLKTYLPKHGWPLLSLRPLIEALVCHWQVSIKS